MAELQEMTLLRIFIGEGDRWEHRPLFEALVELFRRENFSGATVLKGVMGFGGHRQLHADRVLRLAVDLPVVVEVIDCEDKILTILPRLETMLRGGTVTLERVRVLRTGGMAGEESG